MGWDRRHEHTCLSGFSLVELTVVTLIVAILAAVLLPTMRPPLDKAKWSEGYAGAGALATGIRAYCIDTGHGHPAIEPGGDFSIYQVYEVELTGKWFRPDNYSVSEVVYDPQTYTMTYLITVTAPAGIYGSDKTLDQDGTWTNLN